MPLRFHPVQKESYSIDKKDPENQGPSLNSLSQSPKGLLKVPYTAPGQTVNKL